jgi:hypothetical protein
MEVKHTDSRVFSIHMAGDISVAKQVCRHYCFQEGFCVTITPCTYIYTGGEEEGFSVGIINYARFPSSEAELQDRAEKLALKLMDACCQSSFSIVSPSKTYWFSRRQAMEQQVKDKRNTNEEN